MLSAVDAPAGPAPTTITFKRSPTTNIIYLRIYPKSLVVFLLGAEEESAGPIETSGEGEGISGRIKQQKKSTGMPTAKKLVCKYCGATTDKDGNPFETLTDLSTHVRVDCPEYKQYKAKKIAAEASKEGSPTSPYKGEPDANSILRHILDTYPGLPADAVKEVMSWADLTGAPLHPAQVRDLLMKMQKVTNPTADIVAQKYALALQKAQMENKLTGPNPFISPGFSQGPTTGGGPYPYTYQPGFTFGYPPQNPYGGYPPTESTTTKLAESTTAILRTTTSLWTTSRCGRRNQTCG